MGKPHRLCAGVHSQLSWQSSPRLSITHSLILSVFVLELRIMNPVTYTYQESALLFNYIPAPLPSF